MFSRHGKFYQVSLWLYHLLCLQGLWLLGVLAGLFLGGIFPATYAALAVIRRGLVDGVMPPLWSTFWAYYRQDWLKANQIGLLTLGLGALLVIYLRLATQVEYFATAFVFFAYGLMILAILASLWLAVAFNHFDLKVRELVKTAGILMVSVPFHTVGMGLLTLIFIWAAWRWTILLPFISVTLYLYGIEWLGHHAITLVTQLQDQEEGDHD